MKTCRNMWQNIQPVLAKQDQGRKRDETEIKIPVWISDRTAFLKSQCKRLKWTKERIQKKGVFYKKARHAFQETLLSPQRRVGFRGERVYLRWIGKYFTLYRKHQNFRVDFCFLCFNTTNNLANPQYFLKKCHECFHWGLSNCFRSDCFATRT